METSPLDITQREFTRKMRGYDPEEVRTFQEQIAEEMTRLVQQGNDQAEELGRRHGPPGYRPSRPGDRADTPATGGRWPVKPLTVAA